MSAQPHHLDLSSALQAAQAQLQQARAALQQQRATTAPTVGQNAVLSDDAETAVFPPRRSHTNPSQDKVVCIFAQKHTLRKDERGTHKNQDTLAEPSRSWQQQNAKRYVQHRRRLAGIQIKDHTTNNSETAVSTANRWMQTLQETACPERVEGAVSNPPTPITSTTNPQTVRHCPSLGVAAIKEGRAPAYLVWLACRALDHQGRGWLDMKQVKLALTGKKARMRLFGWRRLRQVLHDGEGDFWTWEGNGRLWLRGTARVAYHLNVERLQGRQVFLPVSALTGGISTFKAHLYASWHSGRRRPAPVSRTVQHTLTGVPERTQRHYCRVASIPRQQNIAIGPKHTEQSEQEALWQRGSGTFSFIDAHGEQGCRNGRYIAWQLPTTHGTIHRTKKGNQKRINRKLKDLAQTRGQGNSSESIERIYFPSSEAAVRGGKRPLHKTYWPSHLPSRRRRATVWYTLLKNE